MHLRYARRDRHPCNLRKTMEMHIITFLFIGVFSSTVGSTAKSAAEQNLEETVIYLKQRMTEMEERVSLLENRKTTDRTQSIKEELLAAVQDSERKYLEEKNEILVKMEEMDVESRNRLNDLSVKQRELQQWTQERRDEVLKRLNEVEMRCEESTTSLSGNLQNAESRFSKVDSHLLMEVLQLKSVSLEAVEKVRSVEQEFTSALESERSNTHSLQVQMAELTSQLTSVDLIRKNMSSLADDLRLQLNESLTLGLENIQSNLTATVRNSTIKLKDDCSNLGALYDCLLGMNVTLGNLTSEPPKLNESVTAVKIRRASDCSEMLEMGHTENGVYEIWPERMTEDEPLEVYCDMQTDGGGWTVIQRRGNFGNPEDYFYRDWQSYKEGFGDPEQDFWLGNDYIFALTNRKNYSVRFDLRDVEDNTRYAQYDSFRIEDESHKYRLHIDGYAGDAGDSMNFHKNQRFTTKDQDNDSSQRAHCAESARGGWWYKNCYDANLNGLYLRAKDDYRGVAWYKWKGYDSLDSTEIKIRPRAFKLQHASSNIR